MSAQPPDGGTPAQPEPTADLAAPEAPSASPTPLPLTAPEVVVAQPVEAAPPAEASPGGEAAPVGPVAAEAVAAAPPAPSPVDEATQTLGRWLSALGVVVVLATIFLTRLSALMEPEDLAKGKPWRATSKLADCHPETITCGNGRTAVFFHTVYEDNPWVELDLGAPTTFSSVLVRNRRDGTQDILDRSVPLVLEVGDDQKDWKKLDLMDHSFSTWQPHFPPVTARYVRLRTPRTTFLHLEAVKVYR